MDEICKWGERKYFSLIYNFTATPTDLKYQLSLSNIDWNEISDYEAFLLRYRTFTKDLTEIIFGDLDLCEFKIFNRKDNGEIILYNDSKDITIDRSIYEIVVKYLRKTHNLSKNIERAMTETTKIVLLEEAKEQFEMNQNKEYKSVLLPLISRLTNIEGFKYGWTDVWDMKINAFMDAVSSIQHIKNANLLLFSGYSGFGVDLKKVSKDSLNYFARSDES